MNHNTVPMSCLTPSWILLQFHLISIIMFWFLAKVARLLDDIYKYNLSRMWNEYIFVIVLSS